MTRHHNILDESKAVWRGLDRTLTEAGSNDDLNTELKFIAALSGRSTDAASGYNKVEYSDIKNLSADDKNKLIKFYEESLATRQIP